MYKESSAHASALHAKLEHLEPMMANIFIIIVRCLAIYRSNEKHAKQEDTTPSVGSYDISASMNAIAQDTTAASRASSFFADKGLDRYRYETQYCVFTSCTGVCSSACLILMAYRVLWLRTSLHLNA
jgi:hypothetical protein